MTLKEQRAVVRKFEQPEERDEVAEDSPVVELHSGYLVYTSTRPVRPSRTGDTAKRASQESVKAEQAVVNLLTWQEGWDGYDAPKPEPESVAAAYEWVRSLYRDVSNVLWIEPRVSADDDGEVSFEWWKGRKKLTVYVFAETIEYIKVEKTETSPKMEDGSIDSPIKRRELWNWLIS